MQGRMEQGRDNFSSSWDENSASMRETYRSKGYITPIAVLSTEEASRLRTKYEEWVASLSQLPNDAQHSHPKGDLRFKPHLHLPFVNDVAVRNPALLSVVQEVLGTPNVLLWSSDFNVKPPESDGFFSLHQDATYTGLVPAEQGLTVWLAISDDFNEESGCMSFVEGSHLCGQLPHVEGSSSGGGGDAKEDSNPNGTASNDTATTTKTNSSSNIHNMLSRNQTVDLEHEASRRLVNEGRTVLATLRAGQASLHHFHLLHALGPNRSQRPRIGLALRYIAAHVQQSKPYKEGVTRVSGHLEHDGFDMEPILPAVPTPQDLERGRAAHKESMRKESLNYFHDTDAVKAYDEKR